METCSRCLNNILNPTIVIRNGLCQVCTSYQANYSSYNLVEEFGWFLSNRFEGEPKKCMVGMSGGKDSTVTADYLKKQYFEVTGFTFETGYYPEHIAPAAKAVADKLGIPHETIDIRPYISKELRLSYIETARLFDRKLIREDCLKIYKSNREHYSAKDKTVMPFLRGCQLCRKAVIPAYYGEAVKRGVQIVVLGMNEWTHLSRSGKISAIRKLQPTDTSPPVYIVHLPFLLGIKLGNLSKTLDGLGWQPPRNEDLVETNGNSCCLARATQKPFFDCLGFHPDTTRLSREITAGFLNKEDVKDKLNFGREYNRSVKQVLQEANII